MRGVVFGAIFGAIATYSATRGWWDTVVLTVLLVLAWLSLGEGGEDAPEEPYLDPFGVAEKRSKRER